ncbi:unnamed protein product [Caretta caretta]
MDRQGQKMALIINVIRDGVCESKPLQSKCQIQQLEYQSNRTAVLTRPAVIWISTRRYTKVFTSTIFQKLQFLSYQWH